MPIEFWIVLGLIAVMSIASFALGRESGYHKWVGKMTDETRKEFMTKFYNTFCEKFDKVLEQKKQELEEEYKQKYGERKNDTK